MTTNDWCQALGIERPNLETVAEHRDANFFALLLVALLERGEPMTLVEVAARLEQAGIAEHSRALLSLKRCKPGRPPLYREGDLYALDPRDPQLDGWLFRFHLQPPRIARSEVACDVEAIASDPAAVVQREESWQRQRAQRQAELALLKRALLVTFPPKRPRAAALCDVGRHEITTFVGEELADLRSRLIEYDVLGAVDVRAVLRALDFDLGHRRPAELGPPQKSRRLNKSGRTLRITTAMLVQGSCGIGRPFGEARKLAAYLERGELTKLRRRLEADVKSLYALYEYGRLQGAVRLRWGFLDERIPAPWVHLDEQSLRGLQRVALERDVPLEVVVGSAPGWAEPWSRVRRARVMRDARGFQTWLVDEDGSVIDEDEVQLARLGS